MESDECEELSDYDEELPDPTAMIKGRSKAIKDPTKPSKDPQTVYDFVYQAIEVLGDNRQGVSVQAIKKYVHGMKEMDEKKLNTYVNKALKKGLENGIFTKPRSINTNGATGSFLLVKQKPKQTKKRHAINGITERHASDGETTTETTESNGRKRRLSDTFLIFEDKPKPQKHKEKIMTDIGTDTAKQNATKKANKDEAKINGKKKRNNEVETNVKAANTEEAKIKATKKAINEEAKANVTKKANNEDAKANVTKKANNEEAKANVKKKAKNEESKSNGPNKIDTKKPKANVTKKANMKDPISNVTKTRGRKPKLGNEPEDLSDSEVLVVKKGRKSMKSYSSDTDINSVTIDDDLKSTIESKHEVMKHAKTKVKAKAEKAELPKKSKLKTVPLYNDKKFKKNPVK